MTGAAGLRLREWPRFIQGPSASVLEQLYVPALAEAIRYDRSCAYFSSTALAAAAQGFARLIERLEKMGDAAPRPAIRLLVNEELSEGDVRALTETRDAAVLEAHLKRRFKRPQEALERDRLAMLAWLVKRELLAVRVGFMRRSGGIVHAKYGIITDDHGDALVFRGSSNESQQGLIANYDQLEVSGSWDDPDAHRHFQEEFEALWRDRHPHVATVTLPEALRLELIKFAPEEPPLIEPAVCLQREKAAMLWQFIREAPYLPGGAPACDATALVDPWPHQRRVVEEVAASWPEGRLLCDEVGMGKTIEAILVLRRLMAGRGVRRVLILLPAGLLKQWQAELREKGGLLFPRLEGLGLLVWPDGRTERVDGLAQALEQDALLLSRETARTEGNLGALLAASPWDLVLLDESHAARRRKQEEGEFNSGTLLLTLLRELQLRRRARSVLLLSATPMQTHPWEPWDLLAVLGEGGEWLSEFAGIRQYYGAIGALRRGPCDLGRARAAARLLAADPRVDALPLAGRKPPGEAESLARAVASASSAQRQVLAEWLRRESPLARRMHRNTRNTLRLYHERGLLPQPPPSREIEDAVFDFQYAAERNVYDAITGYIDRRFEELEHEKPGKGFVMTIYRRRAASSPFALERSLLRRRDGLRRVVSHLAVSAELETEEQLDARDLDDLPGEELSLRISAALPVDPRAAQAELAEVEVLLGQLASLGGIDSKRDFFYGKLREITEDGRTVLIFTEYADTLAYVRDGLLAKYGKSLGTYSGDGGQRWDGERWVEVSKAAITEALQRGELRALVCTDAASEGLNLQAAGAVINYDLPWNPSKVEQRIGRIDRIGQALSTVKIVNLFLRHSVDEQVYRVLRRRCGLFEHFVGAMQPVLARARRILLRQDRGDPVRALGVAANEVQGDPLAEETYLESEGTPPGSVEPAVTRQDLEDALREAAAGGRIAVKERAAEGLFEISGIAKRRVRVSTVSRALEADREVVPLTPESEPVHALAERLTGPAARLPLVVGSHRSGPFRAAIAVWVAPGKVERVTSAGQLRRLLASWSGEVPDPAERLTAEQAVADEARLLVQAAEARAREREEAALRAQLAAARARLLRELGRYLATWGLGAGDLNGMFHQLMSRETATRGRLMAAYERLGGYPTWTPALCRELDEFARGLTENQRKARLAGKELDAALQDPRWQAAAHVDTAGARGSAS